MIKSGIIAVVGPTGVGKSKLAIELAQKFKGEIVNADSMQVYKGLDIITNKISKEESCGIRHWLMDEIDPLIQNVTVQDWTANALNVIQEIQNRGKVVILVGGTHYYLQSILTSQLIPQSLQSSLIPAIPGTASILATTPNARNAPISRSMIKEILDKSRLEPNQYAQELSEMLKIIDPVMGNRWHPRDGRKIRRSLEVFYTCGMRHSDIIKNQKIDVKQRYRTCIVWPFVEKNVLEKRLDDRIDEMMEMGLVQEIEEFFNNVKQQGMEMDFTRGIFQAIGFKEFQDYLITKKSKDLEKGLELMKLHTRQYARRQITWIKNKLIGKLKDQMSFVSFDVTDLSKWEDNSLKFTGKVSEFLNGKHVQEFPLGYLTDSEPLGTNIMEWKQFECDICLDKTTKKPRIFNGEHEWDSHLNSRIHKRNARFLKKKISNPTVTDATVEV